MNKEGILTLLNTPKVGNRTVLYILDNFDHYILDTPKDFVELLNIANKENKRIPLASQEDIEKGWRETERILENSQQLDIDILSIKDSDYPHRYRNIPNPPLVLYSKGNKKALNNEKTVAIIGTREPTEFGSRAGNRLGEIFAQNDFTVVSGLAIGCDSVAHRGCLKANGTTVAVMAGGLDSIYPKENRELATEILENNGCLISEYAVGIKTRPNHFVERDRLQSGLSQAVIVIETDIKGGTMHTVKFAEEQHRFLACLWNHPDKLQTHPKIQGNKKLVSEKKAKQLGTSTDINFFISFLSDEKFYSSKICWDDLISNNMNIDMYSNFDGNTTIIETKPGGDLIQYSLNF